MALDGGTEPGRVWGEVTDALLAGLTHDLNGRVAALQGLLHVVATGEPGEQVIALLQQEGERLEQTVALLRRYPRGARRSPEAFDLREVAEDALALHARREDLEEGAVRYARPSAIAVRADRIAATRALLVLLARASVPALGGRGEVALELGEDGEARMAVRAAELPAAEGDDAYLQVAAAFTARAGGVLRLSAGLWEILLPALAT